MAAGINGRGVAFVDIRLEVVVVPVSGVGRAQEFQEITTRLPGRMTPAPAARDPAAGPGASA